MNPNKKKTVPAKVCEGEDVYREECTKKWLESLPEVEKATFQQRVIFIFLRDVRNQHGNVLQRL